MVRIGQVGVCIGNSPLLQSLIPKIEDIITLLHLNTRHKLLVQHFFKMGHEGLRAFEDSVEYEKFLNAVIEGDIERPEATSLPSLREMFRSRSLARTCSIWPHKLEVSQRY